MTDLDNATSPFAGPYLRITMSDDEMMIGMYLTPTGDGQPSTESGTHNPDVRYCLSENKLTTIPTAEHQNRTAPTDGTLDPVLRHLQTQHHLIDLQQQLFSMLDGLGLNTVCNLLTDTNERLRKLRTTTMTLTDAQGTILRSVHTIGASRYIVTEQNGQTGLEPANQFDYLMDLNTEAIQTGEGRIFILQEAAR